MARKAAWEELADGDLGPYAKPRGTRWGRVFAGLFLVAGGTFVAAYYLPLYRAHQRLGQQYQELTQRVRSLSDGAAKTEQELKAAAEERDRLKADREHGESAERALLATAEHAKSALSPKLDKFLKKGNAAIVIEAGSLIVALDGALLFSPQKLDLTPTARVLLCDVAKAAEAKSVSVGSSLDARAAVPAALAKAFPNPWALSAARSAAIADALQVTCAVPASQLSITGNGTNQPLAAQLKNPKLSSDHVELKFGVR